MSFSKTLLCSGWMSAGSELPVFDASPGFGGHLKGKDRAECQK